MKYLIFLFFFFYFSFACLSQDVYRTPTGKRYHLSSCRMVENVSSKLVGIDVINSSKLTPCKICKPPQKKELEKRFTPEDKSVGTSISVQCKGFTKKGKRCKHRTQLANGYCFQHTQQNSQETTSSQSTTTTTQRCGAKTQSGKPCKRKVKGGGYCYQHK